jgi:hypothetical protein
MGDGGGGRMEVIMREIAVLRAELDICFFRVPELRLGDTAPPTTTIPPDHLSAKLDARIRLPSV